MFRVSTFPNEVVTLAEAASDRVTAPFPPVIVAAALNVPDGDAAEPVLHFECAFHVRNLNGTVLVVDDSVARGAGQLNAAEGIVQAHLAGFLYGERAIAVFDFHRTVDTSDVHASETVADI